MAKAGKLKHKQDFDELFETDQSSESKEPVAAKSPEPVEVEETEVETENEIRIKFSKTADAETLKQAMSLAKVASAGILKNRTALEKSREEYRLTGGRRWVCIVNGTTKGLNTFDLIVPSPEGDVPTRVMGRCGVRIEDGLTQYTIDRLQEAYNITTDVTPQLVDANLSGATQVMVNETTRTKIPKYSVRVLEEVKNPKPLGKVKGNPRAATV